MGQIQINTPYEGPQIINIEGEAPTEVEQQAIFEKFFTNPKPPFPNIIPFEKLNSYLN